MRSAERPSVVFVLADDQGPGALCCAGNEEIRTPNLGAPAAGMRFENFFRTSPVCSPARASLMTGRISSAHGVHGFLVRSATMPPTGEQFLEGLTCSQTGRGQAARQWPGTAAPHRRAAPRGGGLRRAGVGELSVGR